MHTRLLKKHILLYIGVFFLGIGLFGTRVQAKDLINTLTGPEKECRYVGQGWYKPFSNIRTDFVIFKDVLNLTRNGNCLVIDGSVDNIVFMIFRIFIGAASVLAVIYIAIAGIAMITEQANIQKRIKAKDMLRHALIGLLLSVSAWVLLYTINRRLVEFSFDEALDSSGIPGFNEYSQRFYGNNIDVLKTPERPGGSDGIFEVDTSSVMQGAVGGSMGGRISGSGVGAQQPPLPGDPNNNNTGNTSPEEPDSLPNPYDNSQPNQGNNNTDDMDPDILLDQPE